MSAEQDDEISDNDTMGGRGDPFVLLKKSTHQRRRNTDMSDHLIAEANRHAKALPKMTLPTTKPNDRDLEWYIAECINLKKQLEMECAAKREHLRIACAEINELKAKAGFYEREIARLRSENAALKNQANDEFDTVITRNMELEQENAALRAWKESALAVERELNAQTLAKLLGARLGESCHKAIAEKVPQLAAENAALRKALETIAKYDSWHEHENASGICPYGCDCPSIAQSALQKRYRCDAARKEAQPIRAEHSGDINEMMQVGKEVQP